MKSVSMRSHSNGKAHSIDEALELLNSAVEDQADEIRDMISGEYKNLKKVLNEAKPEVGAAIGGLGQAAVESVANVKEKASNLSRLAAKSVDLSVRENTWKYMGFATAAAMILGFLFGRRLNPR